MKAFTLEWWLEILMDYTCEYDRDWNSGDTCDPKLFDKMMWVQQRIIKKYGE